MRIAIFTACIALLSVPLFSAPIAVWTVEESDGIEIINTVGDGHWEEIEVGGRKAARFKPNTDPPSRYLYFKLSPEARTKIGSEAYLVVDAFNDGTGMAGTQFNAPTNPYAHGDSFFLFPSQEWEKAVVLLHDTEFKGLQNGGADFRLVHSGGQLTISRVEVHADKPDLDLPSNKERIMKHLNKPEGPTDMYYTFGNDADADSGLLYRSLGVTSIESYVTWETCEREAEGKWDWSRWDKQVEILKECDLKWVPFLILSPAYSTPNWFREGKDHFPCRCLEHGIDSKIESLWNPNLPKWIDRLIGEFAKRYRDTGVIESVLLGIQGDFGEAIYSVWGGGWTFNVPGEYHNHAGYWCDDPYALADFRKFAEKRYKTVAAVNKAWGTEFKSLSEVNFPGRKDELAAFQKLVESGDVHARRRWIDFIDWYREAMTDWSDWWMEITRKHFPDTPIYLCTGGDAHPTHGSDFAEQCRVAAKHGAGVRITNEASNYATNFVITRWVASAGKHYGAYYGFEPAGAEDEKGIVARIYNATASGANQLHDYNPNVVSSKSRMDAQREHIKYLFHVKEPIVPVALWYPNVHMTLKWGGYLEKAAQLRDYTDFDYVDETMLRTGALDRHKVLIILHGEIMEQSDARLISDWVEKGGRVVVMDIPKFESVEGNDEPERILSPKMTRINGWGSLAGELRKVLGELGLPVYDLAADGVFGTQIGPERFLFLNTTDKESVQEISHGGKAVKAIIKPATITDISCE